MIKTSTALLEFQPGPTRAAMMKASKPKTMFVCGLDSIGRETYVISYCVT